MQMRFRGGYNISLQGRPDGAIKVMPEPDVLYLPLCSQRFAFNELNVKDGQKVNSGDVLAKDTDNYAVPLLAPRAGTIRLKPAENHMFREYLLRRILKKGVTHYGKENQTGN
jgi:Na+-transporting NADH:ubiquinone oxidoreductase subunit NqrA